MASQESKSLVVASAGHTECHAGPTPQKHVDSAGWLGGWWAHQSQGMKVDSTKVLFLSQGLLRIEVLPMGKHVEGEISRIPH